MQNTDYKSPYFVIDPDPDGNPTIGYGHECQTATCSEIPYAIPLSYADGQLLLQSDLTVSVLSSRIKYYVLSKSRDNYS